MFKYLLLKVIYDLSDVDVVERSKYDMSFKYFLDMAPEEAVIEPSSLTKFRKLRLKDVKILDMLLKKSVEIALEKGVIKSHSIIVDATHTRARYNQKSPREALMNQSRKVRKAVYQVQDGMKERFPIKNTTDQLEEELRYCEELIEIIENDSSLSAYPKVKEPLNLLKEMVEDDLENL
ncbi:transposase, partial [Fictibacillus iocasae]